MLPLARAFHITRSMPGIDIPSSSNLAIPSSSRGNDRASQDAPGMMSKAWREPSSPGWDAGTPGKPAERGNSASVGIGMGRRSCYPSMHTPSSPRWVHPTQGIAPLGSHRHRNVCARLWPPPRAWCQVTSGAPGFPPQTRAAEGITWMIINFSIISSAS